MENTIISTRQRRIEHVGGLSSDAFVERLESRVKLFSRFTEVVREAVEAGELEQWEYPEVENTLGQIGATVFGVPTPSDSIEQALSQRLPAMSGIH